MAGNASMERQVFNFCYKYIHRYSGSNKSLEPFDQILMFYSHRCDVHFLPIIIMMFHRDVCTEVAPDIHCDSTKLSIDWDNTNHTCPATFTKWHKQGVLQVISVFIEYTSVKYVSNFGGLSGTIQHLFKSIRAQSSFSNMDEYRVPTTVCHTMYFFFMDTICKTMGNICV